MRWVFLWLALGVATQLWLCFRVARSSALLAVATFFLGPVGAVYTLFKHVSDPDTNVTLPFIANTVFSLLLIASAWSLIQQSMREASEERDVSPGASYVESVPLPAAPRLPADSSAAMALPSDPIDAFSAQLSGAGVAHSVTRLARDAALPAGVSDAALIAAPAVNEHGETSALLYRCEAARACRDIAGAFMHKDAASRPRVLQNGLLLLSLPPGSSGEVGSPQGAMAEVFRRLAR